MHYPTIDVVGAHIIKHEPIQWLGVSKHHRALAMQHIELLPLDVQRKYALEHDSPTVMLVHLSHRNYLDKRKVSRKLLTTVTKYNASNIFSSLLKDDVCRNRLWGPIFQEGISSVDCVQCLRLAHTRGCLTEKELKDLLWISFFQCRVQCFTYICSLPYIDDNRMRSIRILNYASWSIADPRIDSFDVHTMLHSLWSSRLTTRVRFTIINYVLTRDHLPILKMILVDPKKNVLDVSPMEFRRWIIHAALRSFPAMQCLTWMTNIEELEVCGALKIAGYRTFI